MTDPMDDLDLAMAMADRADALTMEVFTGEAIAHRSKPDGTPVTATDEAVELALRALVAEHRPDDGFLGEEHGEHVGTSGRRWVVDPVDGTASFMVGSPVWQVLIGLEEGGDIIAGVSSAPAFGARWWGALGVGAYGRLGATDARPYRVSATDQLSLARWACYPDIDGLPEQAQALARRLDDAAHQVGPGEWNNHPAFMVADGSLDLFLQPDGEPWDYAGVIGVVRAAGGEFCYLDGTRPIRSVDGPAPGLFSNGSLAAAALALLT